jgi:hypothetical protein
MVPSDRIFLDEWSPEVAPPARFAGVRKRAVAPQQDAGAPIKEK